MTANRALLTLVLVLAACVVVPASASALVSFRSPSGNIGCVMDKAGVRCDIREKSWAPERPRGCDLDFGQGFRLGPRSRRGIVVCAGDTVLGEGRRLAYGDSIRRGRLRCVSRQNGMICRNRSGGGFRIARADYEIYGS